MSNHPIPSGDRRTAALCWWMGLLWILIFPLANSFVPQINQNLTWAFLALVALPSIGLLFVAVGQWILIQANGSGFVNRCGRQALNNTLSIALYVAVMFGILVASCGIPIALNIGVGYVIIFATPMLLVVHFLEVLFVGILALQGKCHVSAWSIPFFRDRY
jgi:uncharacterized Tic20 family protein